MKKNVTLKENEPPSITVLVSDASIVELLSEHVPNMLKYLESKGVGHHAEDIVSDAFLALLEQREKQQIKDPRAYLFITIRNALPKYYKEKQNNKDFDLTSYKAACGQAIVEDHELIKEIRLADELKRKRMYELMDAHLSEEERQIMELRIMQRKTYEEISQIINKSEAAIRQNLSRSTRRIRNLY